MGAFDFQSLEGLARNLDGANDWFSRPSEAALQPGAQDFALAGWFRPAAPAAGVALAGKWAGSACEYLLYCNLPTLVGYVSGDGSTPHSVSQSVGTLAADTWAFCAMWWDKAAQTLYVQADGGTIYSAASGPASLYAGATPFSVGAAGDGSLKLAGRVSKVGLWIGSYPTADQRTALRNGGKGLTSWALPQDLRTNLVDYWDGDEVAGMDLGGHIAGLDLVAAGSPGSAAGPDAVDAASLVHPRGPSYPVEARRGANVVRGVTLGGKFRSEERGDDRLRIGLRWESLSATHLGYLRTWFATHGAGRKPFLVEMPDYLSDLAAGQRMRMRWVDDDLQARWTGYERYSATVNLVEDLG